MLKAKHDLIEQLRLLLDDDKNFRQPRFHGNGFVQLYLNNDTRLHVWSSALPPLENHNATIHDHTFDMNSQVLLGEIFQKTYSYELVFDGYPNPTHHLFRLEEVEGRRCRPCTNGRPVRVKHTGTYSLREGCEYFFGRDCMHETERSPDFSHAATLMKKRVQSDDERFPSVIAPLGERPVDAFQDGAPDAARLWETIEVAIYSMSLSAIRKIEYQIT